MHGVYIKLIHYNVLTILELEIGSFWNVFNDP